MTATKLTKARLSLSERARLASMAIVRSDFTYAANLLRVPEAQRTSLLFELDQIDALFEFRKLAKFIGKLADAAPVEGAERPSIGGLPTQADLSKLTDLEIEQKLLELERVRA